METNDVSIRVLSSGSGVRLFQHDCEGCKALGEYMGHDLYFCTQGGSMPTVIARYGNQGHEYFSGLGFGDAIPELGEATRRAVAAGYLPENALPKGKPS